MTKIGVVVTGAAVVAATDVVVGLIVVVVGATFVVDAVVEETVVVVVVGATVVVVRLTVVVVGADVVVVGAAVVVKDNVQLDEMHKQLYVVVYETQRYPAEHGLDAQKSVGASVVTFINKNSLLTSLDHIYSYSLPPGKVVVVGGIVVVGRQLGETQMHW